MSTAYDSTGRVGQKRRTRQALIEAAEQLIADGATPTVEDAAALAGISRTTAYRYFTNQRELVVAAHPELDATSLLPDDAPDDPAARLAIVVERITRVVCDREAQHRTMLRLSLGADAEQRANLVLRQGRAIGWIDEALAPLRDRMAASDLRRLVLAVRASIGIEAFVWLTDVARLTPDEAVENMRWSAAALLRAALADAGAS